MIVCGEDGSNAEPARKKTFFCGPRSCVEEIPERDMSGEEAGMV
jgi:hypothetical protein